MTLATVKKTNKVQKFVTMVSKFSMASNMRRAEKEINKLSDRQLEDLGMSRGDIHGRVWGEF